MYSNKELLQLLSTLFTMRGMILVVQLTMGDLDSLLNSLQQRLDDIPQSTNPLARGLCFGCKKDIVGRMMEAMGHKFHPECWKCAGCGVPLGTAGFYEERNKGWCESCHNDQFLPKCDSCRKPMTDAFVSALGKQYHTSCVRCQNCGILLSGNLYSKNNAPHCEKCA